MIFGKIIYRALLTGILLCGVGEMCHAQKKTIADVFREMPDSLLPMLSENNRLDMIDFMASGMKAEVTNRLGGHSEMTALTDDSLRIKVSDALNVTLLLISPSETIDNHSQVICFLRTYGTDESMLQSVTSFYSIRWDKINQIPPLDDADRSRINALNMQTILNWEDGILKKY